MQKSQNNRDEKWRTKGTNENESEAVRSDSLQPVDSQSNDDSREREHANVLRALSFSRQRSRSSLQSVRCPLRLAGSEVELGQRSRPLCSK